MRRLLVCLTVMLAVGIISGATLAQQQRTPEEMQRDVLISNITALRNQELRVAILQQLMDEETSQLMRMQAIFSDQYNLDTNKFRAGMYIYDEKIGKFVERELTTGATSGAGATTPGLQ